ncbi:hypothetical protein BDR06DRAFT_365350 [Suillus hirtellus]|nr:hypothetical protein BDR06DRAFT_365350 [Suillus hirtellus]
MHASSLYALTKVNTSWSTRHPYVAAGALILISANPELLLTPLRLAGRFTLYIFGFRRQGVAKGTSYSFNYRCLMTLNTNMTDSLASQYQSHLYGGYVPRDSTFARFQSYGAADNYDDDMEEALRLASVEEHENRDKPKKESILGVGVSWLSGIGAVFVLGRRWGWWK